MRSSCAGTEGCYNSTLQLAERQLEIFGTGKLDMIMLDRPSFDTCDGIVGQWQALEDLYHANRVRVIALGNFKQSQLECITDNTTAVTPAVNMMRYYVGHGGDTLVTDNARLGILSQAYSPLNSGRLVGDALCESIGAKHGKSGVQVALKWILQHGVAVATQSTSLEHLEADLDVFDFELSEVEMMQLDEVQPTSALHV
jgi:diketogulonate reductase-like aldo/keto reductase